MRSKSTQNTSQKKTPSSMEYIPDMTSREYAESIHTKISELIDLIEPRFRDKPMGSKQALATAFSKAILVMLENRYVYNGNKPHVIKGKFHAG